jgi:hypothetical protein
MDKFYKVPEQHDIESVRDYITGGTRLTTWSRSYDEAVNRRSRT